MKTDKKVKTFNVVARIVAIVGVDVTADTNELALAKANELAVGDFITVDGDHNDSSIRIVSISQNGMWRTDD